MRLSPVLVACSAAALACGGEISQPTSPTPPTTGLTDGQPSSYALAVLPGLGGPFSFASGVSQSGVAVGASSLADPPFDGTVMSLRAVRWATPTQVEPLPMLPGSIGSEALGVADDGAIVGLVARSAEPLDVVAVRWSSTGTPEVLAAVSPGSFPAISRRGVIAYVAARDGVPHVFRWDGGSRTDLGAVSSLTATLAVNDRGAVVADGRVIGDADTVTPVDLFAGPPAPVPTTLNNSGQLAGYELSAPGDFSTSGHGARWSSTGREPRELGALIMPQAINESGLIVGWDITGMQRAVAVAWSGSPVGLPVVAPGPGYSLEESAASDVNASGAIVGSVVGFGPDPKAPQGSAPSLRVSLPLYWTPGGTGARPTLDLASVAPAPRAARAASTPSAQTCAFLPKGVAYGLGCR